MTIFTRLVMLGALGAAGCSTYTRGLADPEGGPPVLGMDASMFMPDAGRAPDVGAPSDVGAPPDVPAPPSDVGVTLDNGGPATTFSCVSFCSRVSGTGVCDQANGGCVRDCTDNLTRDGGVYPAACSGALTALFNCATTATVNCGVMMFAYPDCVTQNGAARMCVSMQP